MEKRRIITVCGTLAGSAMLGAAISALQARGIDVQELSPEEYEWQVVDVAIAPDFPLVQYAMGAYTPAVPRHRYNRRAHRAARNNWKR